jgi:O-antigen/teichoic acid export membrane protein
LVFVIIGPVSTPNQSSFQRPRNLRLIGHNTLILLGVNLVNGGAGLLLTVMLGRVLGDDRFGEFSFVMSWLVSLSIFIEFGLSTVLTRDLAVNLQETPVYLVNSLIIKWAVLGIFLLSAAPFLSVISPFENPDIPLALFWGGLFLIGSLGFSSLSATFKAHQQMRPILMATLAGQALTIIGVSILVVYRQPISAIVFWIAVSQVGQLLLAFVLLRHKLNIPIKTQAISFTFTITLVRRAWPFALAGLLAALQLRGSQLLLAYLDGGQALGWYAAASRLIETGKQLPGAFYAALLPAMAAAAGSTALPATRRQAEFGLLGIALVAVVGALLLGQSLILTLYGAEYQPAVLVLQLLALSLIPTLQNSVLIIFLYANGHERYVNLLIGGGLLINIALSFWLIPYFGAVGVALALLIAESVIYFPYKLRSRLVESEEK